MMFLQVKVRWERVREGEKKGGSPAFREGEGEEREGGRGMGEWAPTLRAQDSSWLLVTKEKYVSDEKTSG